MAPYIRKVKLICGFQTYFVFDRCKSWLWLVLCCFVSQTDQLEVDRNGYIAYCPCMGRFGNQVDHFLGSLAFAKSLNRTLLLPPWVEYRTGYTKSIQVPFNVYFETEPFLEFHRVLTMEDFMEKLAPTLWPVGNRTVFCYMPRESTNDCQAKEGNPFGPFWDTFNVNFDRYPASSFPVLAFMGAPASFPVQAENRDLQRYLVWNEAMVQKARGFVERVLLAGGRRKGAFLGIHLRNGVDWTRACEHVAQSPNLFAAPQCLGQRNEWGKATQELCFPSKQTILKQVKRKVKDINAVAVFVAADNDHMMEELDHALKKLKVRAYKLEEPDPHLDLVILGRANHFIGNCISTFTAFVKRERDVMGFPSSFWAFPIEDYAPGSDGTPREKSTNDEL